MPPVSPTPLLVKPGKRLGEAGKTRVFGHKYLADQLRGCTLDHIKRASARIAPIFLRRPASTYFENSSIFVKISEFFPAKMYQGTVAKILSLAGLGGSRLAHSKNWPPPLRLFEKFGKNVLGGGPPRRA